MRGRTPKPDYLKVLDGDPGKRGVNRRNLNPKAKKFQVNESIKRHLGPEGEAEFRRLNDELSELQVLTELDKTALIIYCAAWEDYLEARKEIESRSAVVRTHNGCPIQSPWVGIMNAALKTIRAFQAEFGLTPAARTRVQVSPFQGQLFPVGAGQGKFSGLAKPA